jgi:hypothetical protein
MANVVRSLGRPYDTHRSEPEEECGVRPSRHGIRDGNERRPDHRRGEDKPGCNPGQAPVERIRHFSVRDDRPENRPYDRGARRDTKGHARAGAPRSREGIRKAVQHDEAQASTEPFGPGERVPASRCAAFAPELVVARRQEVAEAVVDARRLPSGIRESKPDPGSEAGQRTERTTTTEERDECRRQPGERDQSRRLDEHCRGRENRDHHEPSVADAVGPYGCSRRCHHRRDRDVGHSRRRVGRDDGRGEDDQGGERRKHGRCVAVGRQPAREHPDREHQDDCVRERRESSNPVLVAE